MDRLKQRVDHLTNQVEKLSAALEGGAPCRKTAGRAVSQTEAERQAICLPITSRFSITCVIRAWTPPSGAASRRSASAWSTARSGAATVPGRARMSKVRSCPSSRPAPCAASRPSASLSMH
ncbi:MAG: hypothetical protein JXB10_00205 [Pirellulales bacterium]|nr:hypothetical protein [Pirellulales bacterium]